MPRLGPAWRSSGTGATGRGFQPPPAVPDEQRSVPTRERSGSHASGGSGASGGGADKNRNPFAMLDDEEDGGSTNAAPPGGAPGGGGGRFSSLRSGGDNHSSSAAPPSSRPYHRSASGGPKPGGRSLADLAAGLGGNERGGGGGGGGDHHGLSSHHHHHPPGHSSSHRGGDRGSMTTTMGPSSRGSSSGMPRNRSGSGEGPLPSGHGRLDEGGHRAAAMGKFEGGKYVEGGSSSDAGDGGGGSGGGAKVIRYTREKMLSLRGRGDEGPPECLKELEGSVVISEEAQDPVCWDTFDAEEIWAAAARDHRRSTERAAPKPPGVGRLREFDSGDEREPSGGHNVRGGIGDRGSMGSLEPPPRHRGGSFGERGSVGGIGDRGGMGDHNNRGPAPTSGFGTSRWQRGMAIPDDDRSGGRPNSRGRGDDRPPRGADDRGGGFGQEMDDPDDLWDDPAGGSGPAGAAADFSAFGGSLDDGPRGSTGMSAFELSDMSKAAEAFENQLHGGGGRGDRAKSDNGSEAGSKASGGGGGGGPEAEGLEGEDSQSHRVDSSRPLAAGSSGMTIRSGSGDGVNVFEDFGDDAPSAGAAAVVSDGEEPPASVENGEEDLPIKSGTGENNASSRLMKMIGVSGTGEAKGGIAEPSAEEPTPEEEEPKPAVEASVPSNPWGAPASSLSSNPWGGSGGGGGTIGGVSLDSFGRDQQAAKEAEVAAAAAATQRKRQEEELLLQKQLQQQQAAAQAEEEEKKRWAAMQAKQQAEVQAAQQRQQDQVKQQQNQVELVLIERISNILENSWGRSDLNSILSTLHANDSRVIAILSTTEALRALVARHPQRIQLGRDPTMGAEMAALRLTNAQWQSHQAQQAQVAAAQQQAAQQEELQRRQRQLQEEQVRQQQQEAMARAQAQQQAQAQRETEERKKREQQQQQAQAAAPPNVVADAPWFYADPQGNIQGPFGGEEMRQWLEAGYFKGDLPISQSQGGPFLKLSSYFSDAGNAFRATGPSEEELAREAQTAAEAKARAESEARAEGEAKARAEADAKVRAEAEAATEARQRSSTAERAARAASATRMEARARKDAEVEASREKVTSERSEQSSQLKMMLGLGAAGAPDGGGVDIAGPPLPKPVPEPRPEKTKKGKKKQQQSTAPSKSAALENVVPEPAPAAPPAPAWGGVAAQPSNVGRKKSMSEIQLEEAREAARRARELGISGGSGSGGGGSGAGWANVAATGGSTAWGGAAAKMTPAAVVTSAPAVTAGMPATQKATAWNKSAAPPAMTKAQAKSASSASSKKAAVDNFGANGRMTPGLEVWCKEQMQRLNGSEDLTLVQFCMTLTDRDEIRQYLTAYLGSTPGVSAFATEFIKRKGLGDKGKEEEWESTSKKGRKKKGGK